MSVPERFQQQSSDLKAAAHDTTEQLECGVKTLKEKASEVREQVQENSTELASQVQARGGEVKDHLGATVQDVTGKVQEFVGHVTDNPALEAEGMARQTAAELQHENAAQHES